MCGVEQRSDMKAMLSALTPRPNAMSASAATSGALNAVATPGRSARESVIVRSVTSRTQMPAMSSPDPASIMRCMVRQWVVSAMVRS
jgi:hypothetical protein